MTFTCKLAPSLPSIPPLLSLHPLRGTMRASIVAFARAATSAASKSSSPKPAPKSPNPNKTSGIMKPMPLSPTLQAFLGVSELSRPETMKKLWTYIKANNLQSETSKRVIICDEKLKAIFGTDSLTMFEIPKLLNPHFLKQ